MRWLLVLPAAVFVVSFVARFVYLCVTQPPWRR